MSALPSAHSMMPANTRHSGLAGLCSGCQRRCLLRQARLQLLHLNSKAGKHYAGWCVPYNAQSQQVQSYCNRVKHLRMAITTLIMADEDTFIKIVNIVMTI